MDSPRGRILLMRIGHEEGETISPEMATHFDRCLGCMACVTACPSGVQYDKLIERVRPQVEHSEARSRERARVPAGDLRALHPPGAAAGARPGREARAQARAARPRRAVAVDALAAPRRRRATGRCRRSGVQGAGQARDRRVHAGLHPARLLRRRQRGHGAGAERRGLGGPLPALAALLRRAADALGRRGGGRAARGEDDRRVRGLRQDRDQRRRLRVLDEGLRPQPGHRPRARVLRQGRRRPRVAGRRRSRRRCASRSSCARPTTTRATSRTPRACACSRASCCAGSPASSCSSPRNGSSAAARRVSTTCCSPRPRPSSASARPRTCGPPARTAIAAANPGCALQIARYLDLPIYHPMTLLDMSLRGVKP